MRRLAVAVTTLAAAVASASACFPFGGCESDRIEGSFPAAVQFDNTGESWDVSGRVYNSNVDDYSALVEAMIDDTRSTAGLTLTLDQGLGSHQGAFVLYIGPDVSEGQVLTLSYVVEGGGWGFLSPGQAVGAWVWVDDFTPESVSGTLTVLDVAPLRFDVDVEFGDDQGRSLTMTGEMTFQRIRESATCT
jgi:hypothetical protein